MDNNTVSAAAPPKATSYDVLPEALLLTSMLEILRQFTSPQNFSLMDASVVCSIPSLTAFSIPWYGISSTLRTFYATVQGRPSQK